MKINDGNKYSTQHSKLIKHIFQGMTIPQIAQSMCCSQSCVSYHLKQLYTKYNVKTRNEFILAVMGDILENYKTQVFDKDEKQYLLNQQNKVIKKILSGLILNKDKSEYFEYWVQEARKLNIITY